MVGEVATPLAGSKVRHSSALRCRAPAMTSMCMSWPASDRARPVVEAPPRGEADGFRPQRGVAARRRRGCHVLSLRQPGERCSRKSVGERSNRFFPTPSLSPPRGSGVTMSGVGEPGQSQDSCSIGGRRLDSGASRPPGAGPVRPTSSAATAPTSAAPARSSSVSVPRPGMRVCAGRTLDRGAPADTTKTGGWTCRESARMCGAVHL